VPTKPVSHMHTPRMQLPCPEQKGSAHAGTSQASPFHPGRQWQVPLTHNPAREQPLGQSCVLHAAPVQLTEQTHSPRLWSQKPLGPQPWPLLHSSSEQSGPLYPGKHAQPRDGTWHRPREGPPQPAEHKSGSLQPLPRHPGRQMHAPCWQWPLPLQSAGSQLREAQSGPSEPAAHVHRPVATSQVPEGYEQLSGH